MKVPLVLGLVNLDSFEDPPSFEPGGIVVCLTRGFIREWIVSGAVVVDFLREDSFSKATSFSPLRSFFSDWKYLRELRVEVPFVTFTPFIGSALENSNFVMSG